MLPDAAEHVLDVGARAGHLERRAERGELVQQAPQAPHVRFEPVGVPAHDFGRDVVRRAHLAAHAAVGGDFVGGFVFARSARRVALVDALSQPEVGELHDAVHHQHVRGLDVPVRDAHVSSVQVRQRVHDLREHGPDLGLVQRLLRLAARAHESPQIAAVRPLEHDHQVPVVQERVQHPDHVAVRHVPQELHLAQTPLAFLVGHAADVHLLHRDGEPIGDARALVHHRVPALAHRFAHAVLGAQVRHGVRADHGEGVPLVFLPPRLASRARLAVVNAGRGRPGRVLPAARTLTRNGGGGGFRGVYQRVAPRRSGRGPDEGVRAHLPVHRPPPTRAFRCRLRLWCRVDQKGTLGEIRATKSRSARLVRSEFRGESSDCLCTKPFCRLPRGGSESKTPPFCLFCNGGPDKLVDPTAPPSVARSLLSFWAPR